MVGDGIGNGLAAVAKGGGYGLAKIDRHGISLDWVRYCR